MKRTEVPGWIRVPLILGACGWILWQELKRPARRSVESKVVRTARNLAVAATGGLAVQAVEMPVARPLCQLAEGRRWGLVNRLPVPGWLRTLLAVLALDYTLYFWHVMTHRVPFLWRFHQPHHVDRDMDASTALRFHFGEIACSAGWRALQIVAIGVSPWAFSVWQTGLLVCILFHHSNVSFTRRADRLAGLVLITPRMHETHHSNIAEESNSNYSSGLAFWDRLHGTLRFAPHGQVVIGVPAYSERKDVTLGRVLEMPFVEQREPWTLPDGTPMYRRALSDPEAALPLLSREADRNGSGA